MVSAPTLHPSAAHLARPIHARARAYRWMPSYCEGIPVINQRRQVSPSEMTLRPLERQCVAPSGMCLAYKEEQQALVSPGSACEDVSGMIVALSSIENG